MPPPPKPPAQLRNWKVAWFDRTRAGQLGLDRLEVLLGLTRATILKHLGRAGDGETAGRALQAQWPEDLDDLALTVSDAVHWELEHDVAYVAGVPVARVRKAFEAVRGNTKVANALKGLAKTIPATSTEKGTKAASSSKSAKRIVEPDSWKKGGLVGGRWRLDGYRADGGFGESWRASGPNGEIAWAKRAHKGAAQQAALLREIRHLSKLRHKNIVQLLDSRKDGASSWLVVRDGGYTLDSVLRRGRMSLEVIVAWLRPIAAALDYAHDQRVIHVDVNPRNIVRDATDVVRLIDFGTTADMVAARNTSGATTGIASTVVGFDRGFVAPEVRYQRRARKASDQFSLAAVLLAGLMGRPSGEVQVSEVARLVTPKQRSTLDRALHLQAGKRFPTCTAFIDALR